MEFVLGRGEGLRARPMPGEPPAVFASRGGTAGAPGRGEPFPIPCGCGGALSPCGSVPRPP